jgi:2-amino-4-hydroxy-6-hydroxymethyldihydropteridine diphosphokinase
MADAYIGLGSNLGDRFTNLAAARDAIGNDGATITALSAIYDTDPWGPVKQDNYLNQVVRVSTGAKPRELLAQLLRIERSLGRDRAKEERYGPRAIDLDILLYGGEAIDEPDLVIPHPRLAERAFALVPLAEIAPQLTISGTPIRELLSHIDASGVRRYDPF